MKKLSGVVKGFLATAVVAASLAFSGFLTPSAEAASCVDGNSYKDFTGSVIDKNTVTVQTKSGGKLCKDVTLRVTSFTILNPNYNGKGWANNPTAIPQKKFATKSVTMKKGTNGKVTVSVAVPDACTPYQLDAYIGKEQTVIDSLTEGLKGTNAIAGRLFDKTKTDCSTPKERACNTVTKQIEMVERGKENTPPYTTNFDKCEYVSRCDTTTKQVVDNVLKSEAKPPRYVDVNDKACQPVTPPAVLPSTGPFDIASSILGAGSLSGAAAYYYRSRRFLRGDE